MIFHRLKRINKNQKGFTLIELIVAIAITGLITGGLAVSIFQVFDVNARNSNSMLAVRQVQNAGSWISHDTQMAQNVNTEDDTDTPETEVLTLTWAEYDDDGDEYQVVYTVVDDELKREHYTNRAINPDPDATTMVAQYINSTETQFANGKLTLTITATLGGWRQSVSETRVYEIIPRPGS